MRALLFAAVGALVPAAAAAQAWTPPAGSGSLTVAVQAIENTGHLLTDGSRLPKGKSRSASIYVEAEFAPTDRLTLSAGLPFVFARYLGVGDIPGPPQTVDLCRCWHGAWQDLGITARYSVVRGRVGVTPFMAVGLPSHAYAFRGEAVAGRRLREVRVGAAVGTRLDPVSPRLSLQGSYSYALVERVADVPNNRSNATVEGAFAAARRVSVRGFLAWQRTHGGLRAGTGPPPPAGYPWGEIVSEELFAQHDRLLRDNNVRIGSGFALSLPGADVFASYIHYLRGTDSHTGRALTGGISWPFEWHPRRARN